MAARPVQVHKSRLIVPESGMTTRKRVVGEFLFDGDIRTRTITSRATTSMDSGVVYEPLNPSFNAKKKLVNGKTYVKIIYQRPRFDFVPDIQVTVKSVDFTFSFTIDGDPDPTSQTDNNTEVIDIDPCIH